MVQRTFGRVVQLREKKREHAELLYGGFPKLGVPFWGPYNKDYSISGSILGSSYLGNLPYDPEELLLHEASKYFSRSSVPTS